MHCVTVYAINILRGAVIGLAGLNFVKKIRRNDLCHSDIAATKRVFDVSLQCRTVNGSPQNLLEFMK